MMTKHEGFSIQLFKMIGMLLGFVMTISFDAFPVEIFSHKLKFYFVIAIFSINGYSAINWMFGGRPLFFQESSFRSYTLRLGSKEWDLENITVACYTNIILFIGKIAWTAFDQPGYFTIIRSYVKQASLVPFKNSYFVEKLIVSFLLKLVHFICEIMLPDEVVENGTFCSINESYIN